MVGVVGGGGGSRGSFKLIMTADVYTYDTAKLLKARQSGDDKQTTKEEQTTRV